MPNRKIRIKSAGGSLAWRALIVSLCLLVLPLLFHSLFLYRADDLHNLKDVQSALRLTIDAQKALVEEQLMLQWGVLDAMDGASDEDLRRFEIQQIVTPPNVPDHFAVVDKNILYVGKKLYANPSASLAFVSSVNTLMKMLTRFKGDSFPISLSLIDPRGRTLSGERQESHLSETRKIQGADFSLYLSAPPDAVEKLDKTDYVHNFLSLLFFIAFIGGVFVWFITRRIAKPLNQLCKVMERISQGAVHVRYTPDWMGFEINALGKQFNETLDQLLMQSQEAARERISRERLAKELQIGREIQMSLLPKHLPDFSGVDIAQGFLPAREVGGDFYDLFSLEKGKFLIAVADTAGKGISACLYSLGLRSILRTLASTGMSLSDIVLRANALFLRDAHQSGMFVTLWIGIYDVHEKILEYCSQGHPPAFLVHQEKIQELSTGGIALGAQAYDAVEVKKTTLPLGALLFLYTDGIVEAHSAEQQLYGVDRLKSFLLKSSMLSSLAIADGLLAEIEQFSQGVIQHDDITLIAMRLTVSK